MKKTDVKIYIEDDFLFFFRDEKGKKTLEHLKQQLPNYIKTHSSKLKRIKKSNVILYELKVKKGLNYYRVAFQISNNIQLVYISSTLIKKQFDSEVIKYLKK